MEDSPQVYDYHVLKKIMGIMKNAMYFLGYCNILPVFMDFHTSTLQFLSLSKLFIALFWYL